MFLFFVRLIEDRYKYHNINIRYTSVFGFCYSVMYLQYLLYFGLDAEIFSVLLVYILFCIQNHAALVTRINAQLFILYNRKRTA